MRQLLVIPVLLAALMGVHRAQAAVVNFDDVDTSATGSAFVISPYQGFIWGAINNPGFTALNDAHWTGGGNYNNSPGAPSGPNGVLNSGIVNIARDDSSPFDFLGAYFAPFTSNNDISSQGSTALSLFVEGYNGASLVGTVSTQFTAAGYVWLPASLLGVTSLTMYGTNPAIAPFQTRWAMDNFTYAPAGTVPTPASFWLMGLGLLALQHLRRSRRKDGVTI